MSEIAARLEKIEEKLDKWAERMMEQMARDAVLHERNSNNLEEHMRRTAANEARLTVVEDRHAAFERKAQKQLDVALLPIKAVKWLAAFVIGAAAVVSAVKGFLP